jgi:anti-sigma28 factor (negative regulator of flagellin synthesis)
MLETWEASRFPDRLGSCSEARCDRIDAIRKAIADGTYETPEKVALMLDRLIAELRSGF